MSERRPPPKAAQNHVDERDADDASPTVEIVEGDADLVLGHAPTSQGLGFDAVAALAGLSSIPPAAPSAPPPSAPSSRTHDVSARRPSSRAPERPRQTLPTLAPSHGTQSSERSPLSRISTPGFGDVAGALAEAEAALAHAPNDVDAERMVGVLRARLERTHAERLAPLARVVVLIEGATLEGLGHDVRFLAEHVDGRSTIAELVDSSGMTRLDAMRVLSQLEELGVVRFGA